MHILKLGNAEFEGRNNAYLLEYADGLALIDTGISTPDIERQLRERLATHGYGFADVDTVVLTHWHPDHAGLTGAIQREDGAVVYVHENDAPLVQHEDRARERMRVMQRERFDEWGMPTRKREQLLDRLDSNEELGGRPATVETVTDGDVIEIGETQLDVLHAPGHTAGLCCFEFEADNMEEDNDGGRDHPEAFVGDAVLPVYTPNVGGADVRVDRPLERYLNSLETIAKRKFDRVWPGHRDVIDNPTERAQFIVDHHRERARRVVEILGEHGPAEAWKVSAQLFGNLEGIHIMHGPGEAYAHLDHLARHGLVEATPDGYNLLNKTEATIDDVI
jgi:glyoxylase-like metal-dependent hydrolase (beta-lactamase superfamily II)